MKTLVQHLQEINGAMKDGGLSEESRMACLTKIGSIVMHSNMCERKEILDGCDYIDKCVMESDEVDETYKAMIALYSLIRCL